MADLCDKCWYNAYDEESDEYFCDLQLDEDEYAKMLFADKSRHRRIRHSQKTKLNLY